MRHGRGFADPAFPVCYDDYLAHRFLLLEYRLGDGVDQIGTLRRDVALGPVVALRQGVDVLLHRDVNAGLLDEGIEAASSDGKAKVI